MGRRCWLRQQKPECVLCSNERRQLPRHEGKREQSVMRVSALERGGGRENCARAKKSVSLYSVGVSLELSVCLERGRVSASAVQQLLLLLPRRTCARLSFSCCCCCCCRLGPDGSENFGGETRRGRRRAMFRRFRVLVSVSAALPVAVSGQGSENLTFNYRGSVETANFLGHLFRTVGQVLNIAPVDRAVEPGPKPDAEAKTTEDQDEDGAKSGPAKKTKARRRRCLGKTNFQTQTTFVRSSWLQALNLI